MTAPSTILTALGAVSLRYFRTQKMDSINFCKYIKKQYSPMSKYVIILKIVFLKIQKYFYLDLWRGVL